MNKALDDIVKSLSMYRVWIYQAYYNMTAKYKRTAFGSLWLVIGYIAYTLTVAIVWGALFGRDLHNILPHIMLGFLVVMVILSILNEAPDYFIANGGILSNHNYPMNYFIMEGAARTFMTFLHNLPIAIIAVTLVGAFVVPHWTVVVGLPVVFFAVVVWGMIAAMASARFRDLRFVLPQLGHSLLILTPVYWDRSMLGDKTWIADYNPVAALMSLVREPLLGRAPTSIEWTIAFAFCAVGVILYAIFFPLYRRRIPFWI